MSQPARRKRRRLAGVCLGVAAPLGLVLSGLGAAEAAGTTGATADVRIVNAGAPEAIKGSYIVVLDGAPSKAPSAQASVAAKADALTDRFGGEVGYVYAAALRGFSVEMSAAQAKRLAADPAVRYVEQNAKVEAAETWGLDRIDQRDLPLDNAYTAPNDGSGVTAYIVDTGMDLDHPDYGGRASSGHDFIDDDADASDCQGHGTHVGGTVGSQTWGVAKNADLVAVRVLDCSGNGSYEAVIAGIDYVTENAPQAAVGNMSLGGPRDAAVNEAVTNSTAAGVPWAVAAGNSNADACNTSPASTPSALTVAASDNQDRRSIWTGGQASNWGQCVDLFAPGTSITSTTMGGGSGGSSGTSMASPHVAGALALAVSADPGASVTDLNAAIVNSATPGKITDLRGSPNKLLYVGDLGGGEPGVPAAAFEADCAESLDCGFDASGSSDEGGSISSYAWDFGDGATGQGVRPSHSYAAAGTYDVTLMVTDDEGNTDEVTKPVRAGVPPAGEPPEASFTVMCQWATCQFDAGGSSDADGDIASYAWAFGDGQSGTGETASHTYPNRQANYTAHLTVTDGSGHTDTVTKPLTCWSFSTQAFCFAQ
ncbi:PKD domain-containing protein [Streptomyces sp. WMMC500]|uniref:PKD domain-containing protein n=1 Tax=Streptomyces sp. WMMC500 TaxID=3015154 RepID=UPI00248BE2F5|nr:PKD domain-containing protein [Streptomyces sp. WMMC500]WBB61229.1 PKD domain-containing protein [Streptomyces sp. WMMC500]